MIVPLDGKNDTRQPVGELVHRSSTFHTRAPRVLFVIRTVSVTVSQVRALASLHKKLEAVRTVYALCMCVVGLDCVG